MDIKRKYLQKDGFSDLGFNEDTPFAQKNLFNLIIANLPDQVYLKDRKSRFILCNTPVATYAGYKSPKDILGKTDFDLYPLEAELFFNDEQSLMKMDQPLINHEEQLFDKNRNKIRWNLTTKVPIKDHTGKVVGLLGINRDITEIKQAEEKLINANRLYAFISHINQTIVRSTNEQMVFKEACHISVEFGKYKGAWIGMIDHVNQKINFAEGSGIVAEDLSPFTNVPYQPNEPHYRVLQTGTYYVCNNIQNDLELISWKQFASDRGYKSCMILPIKKSGNIIGAFHLYSSEINSFNAAEIALLQEAAGDISFALDVFEKDNLRTQAEKKLKHEELRLKQAQAIAHFGNWELDFSTGIALWSAEALRIYGLSPDDNVQSYESWVSYIHPEDVGHVLQTMQEAQKTLSNTAIFHRIVKRDGTIRHIYSQNHFEFNSEGVPIGMYGVAHDVTEIKEAEAALNKSKNKLKELAQFNQKLLDVSPMGIASYNGVSGKCLSVNAAFAEIIGATLETARKLKFRQINSWKETTLLKDAEATLLYGEVHHNEAYMTTSFGKKIWIDYRFIKFFNKRQPHLLLLINDITEKKQAESERIKIIADIVQRNKDLEQFSYVVSHNLRAPIANIIGLTEELVQDGHTAEDLKKISGYLCTSTKKLDNIITDLNNILQVKKEINEKREIVNLSILINDIQHGIQNQIRKEKVTIKVDFAEINEFITLKAYLYSIFYNLISNSIKYRQPDLPVLIKIKSKQCNGKLIILFQDNGSGIDMTKNGDMVFGLYKRFHQNIEGKGIGLFMVKTEVENLGGKITINSEVNKGTEFKIEFDYEI
jgi:PAS domain S-box-containing protein